MRQYEQAKKAFRRAVEEDIVPLRILSAMQQIVEQVASQEDVPLVDFPSIIREAYLSQYDHAVFGEEYFLDHVHTNMEAYRLLALGLLDQLVKQGNIEQAVQYFSEASRLESGYTVAVGNPQQVHIENNTVGKAPAEHSENMNLFP